MVHFDFETRSVLDLRQVGLWNYARHPSTYVWCMAYAVGDEEPRLWLPGQPMPEEFNIDRDVFAHNAPFEQQIWSEIMVPRHGWRSLNPVNVHCTMALCYAMGLPGGLEDAALALGLSVLKDSDGRGLMLRMARPRNPKQVEQGLPPIWWEDADKLERLYAYCQQDVRVERELHKRVLPLTSHERRIQLLDYDINCRGVAVDLDTARAGAQMSVEVQERAGHTLARITDGAVTSATALIALKQWCGAQSFPVESLDKAHIETYLGEPSTPDKVRLALQVRQEAGKASVAKLDKMVSLAGADGRLHMAVQYCGAATGRWAARGVQVHNLPRNMPKPEIVEDILASVRAGEIDWIETAHGPAMEMVSQSLRSFFVAPAGRLLVAGDFANVEGRGTAWLSGEDWKLAVFRKADLKQGPGVYEMTAHRTLGVPLGQITKDSPERQMGKVQELAFGYGGGVGAARRFLPAYMQSKPDKELNKWKLAWRAVHPRIVATWAALEAAAIAAVHKPGEEFTAGLPGRHVAFKKAGSFLWCKLSSGRVICYPYPKLLPGAYKDQLTYMTVPGEADQIIKDVKNANNWARVSTYGGALMENVIQAICRDLLADKMLELADAGAQIVLHVHDEIVIEVAEKRAEAAARAMQERLRVAPNWAEAFPLWATCSVMARYGKG